MLDATLRLDEKGPAPMKLLWPALALMLAVGLSGCGGPGTGNAGSVNQGGIAMDQSYEEPAANFSIVGKWKNVGDGTWGQMQSGAIVVFDGTNCNVYSPMDTYAFYDDGSGYVLDCTSPLAQTMTLDVDIVSNDEIILSIGGNHVELMRVG